MASDNGRDEDAPEVVGAAGQTAADAAARTPRTHDPVETTWLGTRRPPPRIGRPRLSTVLLVLAFAGLLTVYILLR